MRMNIFYKTICSLTIILLLALGITTAVSAEEYWLRAAKTTVDFPGEAGVPMWGYAGGTTPEAANGPVTVPGPPLTVTTGNLIIHLFNDDLPEPTSLVIPGQNSLKQVPVFFLAGESENNVYLGRVRSFAAEAEPGGVPVVYDYQTIAAGTYLYQSGTHPGVQIAMGLYGALSAVDAAGVAYPGLTYNEELTYLFSEVDVAQHLAIDDLSYGTSAYPSTMNVGYHPDYFLLNGRSYSSEVEPASLMPGNQVLLRVLNAGQRGRVPVIPGVALELLAEDGNPYPTPKMQTSADLPAGKTLDIRFTAPAAGEDQYLALFDRRLGMSDSNRASQGMLAFMAVGDPNLNVNLHVIAPVTPTSGANLIELSSLPGGISCDSTGTNCVQSFLPGTEISLVSSPTSSESLTAWQVYDGPPNTGNLLTDLCTSLEECRLTLSADRWVRPVFGNFSNLTILAPNSDDMVEAGARYSIRWSAPVNATTFNVAYRLGVGTPWIEIVTGTANNSVSWQVPTTLNLRSNGQIAVSSFDAAGNFIESTQTLLGLQVRDSVTLQQPNGGQILTVGNPADDPYPINWSTLVTGVVASRVGLWYQLSSGEPWQLIATVDGSLNSYSWALPSVAAAANNVRVGTILYDAKGEVLVMDTSDAVFSILPPPETDPVPVVASVASTASDTPPATSSNSSASFVSEPDVASAASTAPTTPPILKLLGPSAGDILSVAGGYTVLWQSLIEVDTFSLSYSLDLSENWLPLAQNLTGDQFAWQIDPELQGEEQVLLRLEAFDQAGQSLGKTTLTEPFSIE